VTQKGREFQIGLEQQRRFEHPTKLDGIID
jgi:hypothetical protein